MSKIILGDSEQTPEHNNHKPKKEIAPKPNIFLGRPETGKGNTQFPDWDIVPPNQFINPRIRKQ